MSLSKRELNFTKVCISLVPSLSPALKGQIYTSVGERLGTRLMRTLIIFSIFLLGHVTSGRMKDVLLGATQAADVLIRERLNGLNFGRQFVAQRNLLISLMEKEFTVKYHWLV